MSKYVRSMFRAALGLMAPLAGADALGASSGGGHASGREAVASARHDWKAQVHSTHLAHTNQATNPVGPIPAHFGDLPATTRLAYLLARRDVDPARFDHYHPGLGPILANDERLRAAQGTPCTPMNGLLPNSAHYRYLHYRRNLDPTRFDHYHPALGALLAEDDRLRTSTVCVPTVSPPPAGSSGGNGSSSAGTPGSGGPTGGGGVPPAGGGTVNPTGGGPSAVPEPASLTLILLGFAGAFAARRKTPDKPEPPAPSA